MLQPGAGSAATLLGLAVLVLMTVGLIQLTGGNLVASLLPAIIALTLWAIWSLPLRAPVLVLLVLAWAIEGPGDVFASGLVETPWAPLGRVLWSKLNLVLPVSALVVSGFDLLALLLFAVIIHRHARRATIDRDGWVPSAPPLATFAWISLAGMAWLALWGMSRGGEFRFVLWQSTKWLYVPVVYALMQEALRGPKDALLLGKVVLGVGLFRAVEAIVFRLRFPSKELMAHATSHHDSVLFATCVAILAAGLLEMPSKRLAKICGLLLPIYFWAMIANNRRLVWVEVGLALVFFFLVAPWRPLKVKVTRLIIAGFLPFLLYAAVGWNSEAKIFVPVYKLRSIVDTKKDASSRWRDLENYNLVETFRLSPLLGSGFGHPMVERIRLPSVMGSYELEPYIPHNSVLGIWAFGGLVGFALLWSLFPVGAFFAVRAYRFARTPLERVTALSAAAVQIAYLLQGYGDLGFGTWGPVFTVAASYVMSGKICFANGGWGPAPAAATGPAP